MIIRRNDFLELAIRNVFEGKGYRAGILKAKQDLKLTNIKAKELFDKGETEIG